MWGNIASHEVNLVVPRDSRNELHPKSFMSNFWGAVQFRFLPQRDKNSANTF